jgi:hypothetical protein
MKKNIEKTLDKTAVGFLVTMLVLTAAGTVSGVSYFVYCIYRQDSWQGLGAGAILVVVSLIIVSSTWLSRHDGGMP